MIPMKRQAVSDDLTPTPDDLARDLRADLAYIQSPGDLDARYKEILTKGLSAALRRAIAAEHERDRLKAAMDQMLQLFDRYDVLTAGVKVRAFLRQQKDKP